MLMVWWRCGLAIVGLLLNIIGLSRHAEGIHTAG